MTRTKGSFKSLAHETKAAAMIYQLPNGKRSEDPAEPPASFCYPHPAASHEPRIQQLAEDFANLGLKPFRNPLGVMLNERDPHTSRYIRCDTCDGFPCLVYTKSNAQVCAVDPALTIMANALRVGDHRMDRMK